MEKPDERPGEGPFENAGGPERTEPFRPEDGPGEYRGLDPRVIRLWVIEGCIWSLMVASAVGIGSGILYFNGVLPAWVLAAGPVLAAFLLSANIWLPYRRFAATAYRLNERVFELKSGIFWRRSVLIPLSRVQHLDLERGPLERRVGLATLKIHTAGTANSTHPVPGLEFGTASRLRTQLAAVADLEVE